KDDTDRITGADVTQRDGGTREDPRAGAADGDTLAEPPGRLALERDTHAVAAEKPVRRSGHGGRHNQQDTGNQEQNSANHEIACPSFLTFSCTSARWSRELSARASRLCGW